MGTESSSQPLRFARHIVGMSMIAVANPLIYYSDQTLSTWAITWMAPLIIAGVFFALYALFFTKHARSAWPKSFFILAWVFLVLTVAGPYIELFNKRRAASDAQAPRPTSTRQVQQTQPINPINGPADTYDARVQKIRNAAKTGALQTLTTRPKASIDENLGGWPYADTLALENSQTWWLSDNNVWIHVINQSTFKMDAITFKYAPSRCSIQTPSGEETYIIYLEHSVHPGSEALVKFSSNGLNHSTNGCLTIVGVLG